MTLPVCILYTQDAGLAQRVTGYLSSVVHIRREDSPSALMALIEQRTPALLIVDLHSDDWQTLLPRLFEEFPRNVVIALGHARSAPAMEAERLGVYAVEDRDVDRLRLRAAVTRAAAHLRLTQENEILRQDAGAQGVAPPPAARSSAEPAAMPLATFLPAIRQIDNADAMVESMVEAVAAWAKVSRVGLFTAARGSDRFRLRAGIHCLPDTWEAEVASESALVRWMQARAHVISRSMLAHVAEAGQRLVLKQALDGLGAEVIIPLHGRRGLIGWIFVGHRVTGIPFAVTDLEDLVLLVENVSCTLENALLYEEVAVQKTLAETVLGSVPVGIVAVSADGVVRWYNAAAEGLLSMPASEVLNRPASRLSSRLADLLTRCVRGEGIADCSEWTEISTRRTVSVSVRRLESRGQRLGAVALIHDLTAERAAREQREETERMAFWSQLAALMAHQVYNKIEPMSALVQLLPERHQDPEFRDSFARVAAQEIENLKRMIKEIEDFATPTRAKPAPLELAAVVAQAVDTAQGDFPKHPVRIETTADDGPHRVLGDAAALTRCFVHVISNSLENLRNVADPRIQIVVFRNGEKNGGVVGVRMQDNGTGISPDLLADIWKAKPLNTTTPSRIGLGLPIVKRTVTEHKGEVNLETSPQGTTVTVRLPALSENGGGEA